MKPDISIFFPAFNEEENIRPLLEKATSVMNKFANNYEIIIVVFEASTDNTINIVNEIIAKDNHVRLVIQPKEMKGIGYAIRQGFDSAKYEHIFYTDADNQFELEEIDRFVPYIGDYDVIAGYRKKRNDPFLRILTAIVYNIIVKILFGIKERDVDCAFRYVNKRVFEEVNLICKYGMGTSELLAKARKYGYKIKEIPVTHYPRKLGQSKFEGKRANLPRVGVVMSLVKELNLLWRDMHRK